jgi:hypothetical protein
VRVPFTTGRLSVYDSTGALLASPTQQRGGSAMVGGEARLRVAGPVSLVATGIYSPAGDDWFFPSDTTSSAAEDYGVRFREEMLLGRAGLSFRFVAPREKGDRHPAVSTELVLAGGMVRELETTHPAVSVGFQGAMALGGAVDVVLGIDDYVVLWDRRTFEPQIGSVLRYYLPDAQGVRMGYSTSNVLALRAGLSLRL